MSSKVPPREPASRPGHGQADRVASPGERAPTTADMAGAGVSVPDQPARSLAVPMKAEDEATLRLFAEDLEVVRETVETGRLRIAKATRTREALVDELLNHETVEVETVPVGRAVTEMPAVRSEGETLVIPVVEEQLVVERRLVLKEEIRITRRRTTKRHLETVTLRFQEATVTRVPGEAGPSPLGDGPQVKQQTQGD
jgi:uncharacterized protein (TIGR02271 family)